MQRPSDLLSCASFPCGALSTALAERQLEPQHNPGPGKDNPHERCPHSRAPASEITLDVLVTYWSSRGAHLRAVNLSPRPSLPCRPPPGRQRPRGARTQRCAGPAPGRRAACQRAAPDRCARSGRELVRRTARQPSGSGFGAARTGSRTTSLAEAYSPLSTPARSAWTTSAVSVTLTFSAPGMATLLEGRTVASDGPALSRGHPSCATPPRPRHHRHPTPAQRAPRPPTTTVAAAHPTRSEHLVLGRHDLPVLRVVVGLDFRAI